MNFLQYFTIEFPFMLLHVLPQHVLPGCYLSTFEVIYQNKKSIHMDPWYIFNSLPYFGHFKLWLQSFSTLLVFLKYLLMLYRNTIFLCCNLKMILIRCGVKWRIKTIKCEVKWSTFIYPHNHWNDAFMF